jgi:hypothetical protein
MATALRVHEKLLLAAADLEDAGKPLFSAEDLVVAAWERDADTFGLAGYPDEETGKPRFPNSNRVFAEIMGSKPIRQQGLLVKTGTKMFRLTETGRRRADALRVPPASQSEEPRRASFSRPVARRFERLLGTRAVDKLLSGRREEITFTDAAAFWGVSARSTAMEFQGRIGEVEGVLRTAGAAAERGPLLMKHGARAYAREDIEQLLALHEDMLERFKEEISFIRKRTDER